MSRTPPQGKGSVVRSLWVWGVVFVYTILYATPIVVRALLRSTRLRCTCRWAPRRWSLRILRAAAVQVELEGGAHIPADRASVLVVNHQSWFDVWALAAHLPVDYRFVAKKELEAFPLFGAAWKACGHVSIDRGDLPRAIASLEETGRMMRADRPTVVMFPEGTRSSTGELRPFKKGAFVLAIRSGAPIVPAAIVGSHRVLPKGAWRVRPGPLRVRIGTPIPVEGLAHEDREALARVAHDAVARLKAGAPLEGPWGTPGERRPSHEVRD